MISVILHVLLVIAIIIAVLFFIKSFIVLFITFSVILSKLLVASSIISMSGFFKIALAIDNLCLCPPEKLVPPCATNDLYPCS